MLEMKHPFAKSPLVCLLAVVLMAGSLFWIQGQGLICEAKAKNQAPKIQKPWEDPNKARFDLLSWPQKTNHAMACLIEHTFKEHDSHFRCDDPVRNDLGDPCTNKKDYWTGPTFPTKKSYLVHKTMNRIQLKYEYDELRSVKVWLNKPQTLDQLNYLLQLPERYNPADPHGLPANVQMVEYVRYAKKLKPGLYDGIIISGYDYLGHGKIKCPTGE
jgi:hypothetical protein